MNKIIIYSPTKFGGEWKLKIIEEIIFSKKFKVLKDHFGLNDDYGLYSFKTHIYN
jgi:hypothetical protein